MLFSLLVKQNPHFKDLEIADWADLGSTLEVDVLTGSDDYWELVTGTISKGAKGPTAIHTKLGWVLSGPIAVKGPKQSSTNLVTTHALESLGIQPIEEACEKTISNIRFREGRYEVALPWKQFHQPLPDNYCVSQQRLKGLLRHLQQNPVPLQDYNRVIQEQIEKGIVEDASNVEGNSSGIHYLPHHTVIRSNKDTTKM